MTRSLVITSANNNEWGSLFGFNGFGPKDASAYEGMAFWARAPLGSNTGFTILLDDLNERELDSYFTVDLLARWRFSDALDLFAAVENLLDEEIETGETADGLVSIGAPRLARVGLRWVWE